MARTKMVDSPIVGERTAVHRAFTLVLRRNRDLEPIKAGDFACGHGRLIVTVRTDLNYGEIFVVRAIERVENGGEIRQND